MDVSILVSLASIGVTFFWGIARGGSAYNAYYQLWRFLTALLVGLMLLAVVRTARDLKALGITIVAAALVRGTLAMYFYWTQVQGKMDPLPPHMTTHDDSLLFVAGMFIVLSHALMRARWTAWVMATLVCSVLLYAIVLNDRRIAWVELILGLGIMFLLLPPRWRRRAMWTGALAAPVLAAYVAAGQGRTEGIFAPVQALSSVGSDSDGSSLARQEEARNLLYTLWVKGNPLFGTGWGVPYEKVTSVYANYGAEWWQYVYLPHNSILGIAVFAGLVGLCGIWLVVPMAAYLAMRGYRGATLPAERAGAMAALCILPGYAAQCYGDIAFQSLTCNIILSVAIAVASKVSAWAPAEQPASSKKERARVKARATVALAPASSGRNLPASRR
jgi:hypothetical protein